MLHFLVRLACASRQQYNLFSRFEAKAKKYAKWISCINQEWCRYNKMQAKILMRTSNIANKLHLMVKSNGEHWRGWTLMTWGDSLFTQKQYVYHLNIIFQAWGPWKKEQSCFHSGSFKSIFACGYSQGTNVMNCDTDSAVRRPYHQGLYSLSLLPVDVFVRRLYRKRMQDNYSFLEW